MLTTTFPGTDLKPSVLCLGAGSFGSEITEADSFAMLDSFAESGGNFADSAHIYAAWRPDGVGASERTLGKWLADRKPQDFIVSTKGGHPELETMDVSRLSPAEIARDVEESLERLGVETIDLYWLHRDDENIPIEEIVGALDEQVAAGRLRWLGASNWRPGRIAAANEAGARNGWKEFCANQIGWSLAEVNAGVRGQLGMLYMDAATLTWHRRSGVPAVAYSSQAGGFFARPLPPSEGERSEKEQAQAVTFLSETNTERYRRAHDLAQKLNRSANEVALAYVWSQTFPSVAIVGCRNLEQLSDTLRARDLRLDAEQVAYLEAD